MFHFAFRLEGFQSGMGADFEEVLEGNSNGQLGKPPADRGT